jgi:hypothetical protein
VKLDEISKIFGLSGRANCHYSTVTIIGLMRPTFGTADQPKSTFPFFGNHRAWSMAVGNGRAMSHFDKTLQFFPVTSL